MALRDMGTDSFEIPLGLYDNLPAGLSGNTETLGIPKKGTMRPKIIVLDDDPTGSQTVHGCLLLTRWDVETLTLGLTDCSPIFFILTNARANPAEVAAQITREVCRNLRTAIATTTTQDFLVVSRSDSTLRGHYPLETDIIAEELGPFDAHFLVPAFLEGGRITRDSVHYVRMDGELTPVHETEFAEDAVFGYHHSYLPDYVAEKTQGRIPADQVERITYSELARLGPDRFLTLHNNTCVVVDGTNQADLDRFAEQVLSAAAQGKRFLFRSAASLLTALAQLPPQPVPAPAMGQYVRQGKPGIFIVGSHVQTTSRQLSLLLNQPGIVGVEVEVAQLRNAPDAAGEIVESEIVESIVAKIGTVHRQDQTPVVYTSRQRLAFDDSQSQLQFGLTVSWVLTQVVQTLPADIGYLVSKGGNTSNNILSQGLDLRAARLLGQILAGCCLVQTPAHHPRYPHLPVVLFPGNVGDDRALVTVYQRLTAET